MKYVTGWIYIVFIGDYVEDDEEMTEIEGIYTELEASRDDLRMFWEFVCLRFDNTGNVGADFDLFLAISNTNLFFYLVLPSTKSTE